MTEYLLPTTLATDEQTRMAQMLKLGRSVDWVRAAERAIGAKIVGCEWHIEDPDGDKIDDEYKDPIAVEAYNLIADPQGEIPIKDIGRRQSRRQFLSITSRHMGMCGNGAWMEDMVDDLGVPHALLYIRPDRLTPDCDKKGVLQQWLLDKKPGLPGTPIGIEELRLLQFEPPDIGVFGIGLIEASIAKAINNGLVDRHYSTTLAAGGRISGILAPKDGAITDDGVLQQLEKDWRNIVEQPEAARRLQIVRAPVEFHSTVMTAAEIEILEFMNNNRDALLALWGVPLTMLNGQNAGSTGLNGGESRKYDEATMWQAAVHDRLEEMGEAIQDILDKWELLLGWAPTFCWDEPSYDDQTPAYERAAKVKDQPLRNRERREILGLEPFGEPGLDEAIWMPAQVVAMAMAPGEDGKIPSPVGVRTVDNPQAVAQEPGGMAVDTPASAPQPARGTGAAPAAARATTGNSGATRAKADALPTGVGPIPPTPGVVVTGVRRVRDALDTNMTPALAAAVGAALNEQRDQIADAIEKHWDAISRHRGADETQWWRGAGLVGRPVNAATQVMAERTSEYISEVLGGG